MNLESLIPEVCAIARQAAAEILKVYEGEFAVEHKDDRSPLTAADLAAHHCIIDGLRKLTPDLPILSEESATISGSARSRVRHRVGSPSAAAIQAPPPCQAQAITPVTGTWTTPSTLRSPSIKAMFTVNSPLRLTNSRVPSSGSTNQ